MPDLLMDSHKCYPFLYTRSNNDEISTTNSNRTTVSVDDATKEEEDTTAMEEVVESEVVESASLTTQALKERYPVGMMVWGKLPGYDWWPGSVISYDEAPQMREGAERNTEPQVWIKWFGENQLSQVCTPS